MKRVAMAAALYLSLLAPLVSAQTGSKPAGGPLATGIARNQQELQELAGFVARNNAEMKSIVGDIMVSLAGAVAGTGSESEFGQGPRQLITAYQKIKDAMETDKDIVDGDGWMTVSDLLKQALDIVGETELPVKLANTLTDLAVKTSQMVSLAQQNADLVAAEVKVARAQAYLLAKAKAASQSGTAELDKSALQAVEDYLAKFPIRLQPLPENPDGTDANGADLDKALNENITREMGADNQHLPDFLIHPLNYNCKSGPCTLDQWIGESNQSQADDWTRLQNAFQGMAQIANAFNPPHRSPITPELLAAMDAWVKRLGQLQALMFQALAAAGNSPACKVVGPTGTPAFDGFDDGNPVHYSHHANAAECNRLYAVFRGYRDSFMGSTPPPVKMAGGGANNQSSAQGKRSSGATTTTNSPAKTSSASSSSVAAAGTQSPAIRPAAAAITTGDGRAASPRGASRTGGVDFSGPQSYVTNPHLNSQVDRLIHLIQETEQVRSRIRNSLLKLDPTLLSRIATTRSPNLSLPPAHGATANNPASPGGSRGTPVGSSSSLRGTPSQAARPAIAAAPLTGAQSAASPREGVPKGGIDFSGPQAYKPNPQLDSEVDKLQKQAEADESKQKKK